MAATKEDLRKFMKFMKPQITEEEIEKMWQRLLELRAELAAAGESSPKTNS